MSNFQMELREIRLVRQARTKFPMAPVLFYIGHHWNNQFLSVENRQRDKELFRLYLTTDTERAVEFSMKSFAVWFRGQHEARHRQSLNFKWGRLGIKSKRRNAAVEPGPEPVQGRDHSCSLGLSQYLGMREGKGVENWRTLKHTSNNSKWMLWIFNHILTTTLHFFLS